MRYSTPAANALEMTVGEATALGHNYVGCEHLLIGLAAEPDGIAGRVLREAGADAKRCGGRSPPPPAATPTCGPRPGRRPTC